MCHWNEMYCETYLADQPNTQTVISLKPKTSFFGQNGIDITWNNAQKAKLVTQLMTGIMSFLQKWHNTVSSSTDYKSV